MIAVLRSGSKTLSVKRSDFIASSYRIQSRDDVKPIIDRLKAEHTGARHVCYAFIADEKGDDFGYDDNGEPSGTAGKPIYSALAACGAKKSVIAVVRYFGGIKLGAGGLTRAYRQSASDLIAAVGLVTARKCAVYGVTGSGEGFGRAIAAMRNVGCGVEGICYAQSAVCTAIVPAECESEFVRAMAMADVHIEKSCERYVYDDEQLL